METEKSSIVPCATHDLFCNLSVNVTPSGSLIARIPETRWFDLNGRFKGNINKGRRKSGRKQKRESD